MMRTWSSRDPVARPRRRRECPRRRFLPAAALVALQWALANPAPASPPGPTSSPSPCDTGGARLELHLSADPSEPVVGDVVELAVTITNPSGGLAGLPSYSLVGAAPVFTAELVESSYPIPEFARYRLTAIAAGRATLRASVHYETAHRCFGYPTFFFRSSSADPFVIDVRAAHGVTDTPTPTITPTPTSERPPPAAGAGDCDGDGRVTVAEIVGAVAIALGTAPLSACAAADADASGAVTIADLVAALGAALDGCAALRPSGR